MKIMSACRSDVGLKRSNNEDRFVADDESGLFMVCDGMGGHAAGEVAAETASQEIAVYLGAHEEEMLVESDTCAEQLAAETVVSDAIKSAYSRLFEMARTTAGLAGMGTTASLLLKVDGKAGLGHVGDSRVYLYRNESIAMLTRDHTIARESSPDVNDYEVKVKKYVGLGILSQAGVAIGLSLIVVQEFGELSAEFNLDHAARIGTTTLTTVTATCIFFEIIGPIFTKIALQKAGEIPVSQG